MKNSDVYVQHILDAIATIEHYVKGVDEAKFFMDQLLQDGVTRQLEIIGEATTKLPLAFRKAHTKVPWTVIVSMRNKLIHEYFGVSASTIYQAIHKDLPLLKQKLVSLY